MCCLLLTALVVMATPETNCSQCGNNPGWPGNTTWPPNAGGSPPTCVACCMPYLNLPDSCTGCRNAPAPHGCGPPTTSAPPSPPAPPVATVFNVSENYCDINGTTGCQFVCDECCQSYIVTAKMCTECVQTNWDCDTKDNMCSPVVGCNASACSSCCQLYVGKDQCDSCVANQCPNWKCNTESGTCEEVLDPPGGQMKSSCSSSCRRIPTPPPTPPRSCDPQRGCFCDKDTAGKTPCCAFHFDSQADCDKCIDDPTSKCKHTHMHAELGVTHTHEPRGAGHTHPRAATFAGSDLGTLLSIAIAVPLVCGWAARYVL